MKKRFLSSRIALVSLFLLAWVVLVAFQGELPARVDQVIAAVVSFAIMLLGPKPLKAIFDLLKLPGGVPRVIATWVVAVLVGAAALLVAGAISGLPTSLEQIWELAGLLALAVQAAYNRLKDLGAI